MQTELTTESHPVAADMGPPHVAAPITLGTHGACLGCRCARWVCGGSRAALHRRPPRGSAAQFILPGVGRNPALASSLRTPVSLGTLK